MDERHMSREEHTESDNIPCEKLDLKKLNIKNKYIRQSLIIFMIVVMIGLGYTGYTINEINTRAFNVYLGDDLLGSVRTEEDAKNAMEELKLDLKNTYGADVVLDKDLSFEPTHVKDENITSTNDLKKGIKSKINFQVVGYALYVNNEEIGILKTEEEIESILDHIKEPYTNLVGEGSKIKDIHIVEDIRIEKRNIPLSEIDLKEEMIEYLETAGEELKTHVVEVGESFWTIAKIYNTTVDELIAANQEKEPTKLKPGDEVRLMVPKSKITVATIEEVEYIEDTKYEVIVENNDSMYANEKKVKVKGEYGSSKILANEVKHNGILVAREVLQEEVIKNPVNEVVVKGTKPVPKTAATGVFLMPTRGTISSRYGMRNGRMHRGLDIAAKTGTPIYAADGGTVTFSGWKGNYGNMVEIDHGNGYKTRYAHASKLLVKKGEKVYKGQHIANVGSTGRSTGPHLHLEVLKNGVYQNPSNYVK